MNNIINNYRSVAVPRKIQLRNKFRSIIDKFSITNISAGYITAIMMIVFSVTAVMLCTLNIQVYQLNNEISDLEAEYAEILTVNDELSGRILAQSNLGELEKYASVTLGMRKPTSDDYEYISYTPAVSEDVTVTDEGGFFDGIMEFFGF